MDLRGNSSGSKLGIHLTGNREILTLKPERCSNCAESSLGLARDFTAKRRLWLRIRAFPKPIEDQ